jgi:hypothetical protein
MSEKLKGQEVYLVHPSMEHFENEMTVDNETVIQRYG